jgi:hypothetical protein
MKRPIMITVLASLAGILFLAFTLEPAAGSGLPDEVKEVLKNSCFNCHSDNASNKKAKVMLNFDKWEGFKASKKISKMDDICEMVEKGKMPPEKYLGFKPEAALSDAQKELLCNWADQEAGELMKGDE